VSPHGHFAWEVSQKRLFGDIENGRSCDTVVRIECEGVVTDKGSVSRSMSTVASVVHGWKTLQCMTNEGVTSWDGVHTTGYKLGVTSKTAASLRKKRHGVLDHPQL